MGIWVCKNISPLFTAYFFIRISFIAVIIICHLSHFCHNFVIVTQKGFRYGCRFTTATFRLRRENLFEKQ